MMLSGATRSFPSTNNDPQEDGCDTPTRWMPSCVAVRSTNMHERGGQVIARILRLLEGSDTPRSSSWHSLDEVAGHRAWSFGRRVQPAQEQTSTIEKNDYISLLLARWGAKLANEATNLTA